MKPNMKKAFIDQILFGLFLIATVFVFIATVSDELKTRNKFTSLKQIVQTSVLSASKYYINENNDTAEAQNIALGIIEQSQLGAEVKDRIEFTWDFVSDPSNVVAKIENYEEDMFWYRLLGWDSYTFDLIEAKANIILTPMDELPILDEVSDFMPFAINECGQEEDSLLPGESLSFIYKPYDIYDSNESTGFYGLRSDDPDRNEAQNDFAHFKNEVSDFNRVDEQQYLVNSTLDSIENDASQLSSALEVKQFDEPLSISIALIDCSSTKDNIVISNLIQVSMTNIYCGLKSTDESLVTDAFEDQTGDVFDSSITWITWTEDNDCSQSGLFRIDLDITIPEEETIILEY
ncbi:MAG: hypothetical protein KAQ94_02130 [Arcobacteraceae bacterium]|nr:hypothetical protein [Arcobacteraceae bacterium]